MLSFADAIMVVILILSIISGGAVKRYYRMKGKDLPTGKKTMESKVERTILFACLTLFGLLYAVLAPFLLLFGYFEQVLAWSTLGTAIIPIDIIFVLKLLGIILYMIGYAMFLAGRIALKGWFAEAWKPSKIGKDYVSTGIYSRIRHPLYSGGFIYLTGLVLFFQTWFGLALMIPVYVILVRAAFYEEKFLKEKFGRDYEMYMKRTGRFFPKLS